MVAKKLNPRILILVFLVLLTVVLRVPSLFEPNRYADEDIYLTLGQAVRKGQMLYRDIHDNKPPGVYLTAAVARTVPGFRAILLVWHAASVIFFFLLIEQLTKKRLFPAGTATLAYVILTTIPLLEGNIANGEIFMIVPEIIAAWVFTKFVIFRPQTPRSVFVEIGLLFSLGFLFKVTAALDFAAIALFYFFITNQKKKFISRLRDSNLWLLAISFALPILISVIYYVANGAGEPYIRSALLQNIGYLSSWSGGGSGHLKIFGLILMISLLGLYKISAKISRPFMFASVWFLFALFGALISSRPYPHYLLQPAVPGTLLVGLILTSKLSLEKITLAVLTALTLLALYPIHFWRYPSWPYYQNFIKYALGQQTKSQHDNFFPGVAGNRQITDYIRTHTLPADRIFVWGTEPAIYAASDRLPVGRYTTSYHVRDFDDQGQTFQQVMAAPPPVIVTFDYEPDYLGFLNWVNNHYTKVLTIENATVYRYLGN